jgi:hypothetical protein
LPAVAIAAAVMCACASATAPSVNVLQLFKPELAKIHKATKVPVLLPAKLPILDRLKVYGAGYSSKSGWELDLAFAKNCFGADACFLGEFKAQKGGALPGAANVRLASGDPALYKPISCGGSCAPANLWFTHGGVLYSWQDKSVGGNAKTLLVRLANEAIAAGPR